MKTQKLLFLTLIGVLSFLAVGCDSVIDVADAIIQQQPASLSDSRFNGTFSYFDQWEDSWGIEERYEYTSFRFNGTNKIHFYTKYYRYSTTSGWSYSGDYIGDYYSWYLELQVQNGLYRFKLWDNEYSDWHDWEPYSFSSDGKTLTFQNWYNITGYDYIVSK